MKNKVTTDSAAIKKALKDAEKDAQAFLRTFIGNKSVATATAD